MFILESTNSFTQISWCFFSGVRLCLHRFLCYKILKVFCLNPFLWYNMIYRIGVNIYMQNNFVYTVVCL